MLIIFRKYYTGLLSLPWQSFGCATVYPKIKLKNYKFYRLKETIGYSSVIRLQSLQHLLVSSRGLSPGKGMTPCVTVKLLAREEEVNLALAFSARPGTGQTSLSLNIPFPLQLWGCQHLLCCRALCFLQHLEIQQLSLGSLKGPVTPWAPLPASAFASAYLFSYGYPFLKIFE